MTSHDITQGIGTNVIPQSCNLNNLFSFQAIYKSVNISHETTRWIFVNQPNNTNNYGKHIITKQKGKTFCQA